MIHVDTALRPDAQKRLRAIGQADLVIGMPTYKNAKTIANFMAIAAEGASHHFADMNALIVGSESQQCFIREAPLGLLGCAGAVQVVHTQPGPLSVVSVCSGVVPISKDV